MSDPFDDSKYSLGRAKDHISDLERHIEQFFKTQPYSHTVEIDANTGEEVHKYKLTKPMPVQLKGIARDAVLNLRAALDHLMFALTNPKHCSFPFGNNCYEFVAHLVGLAAGLDLKPPSAVQANAQNRNMVKDLGLGMIKEAMDYNYINNISDGFKDNLVGGFQNAGVYGHVLLQAGAHLVGGLTGLAYASGFAGYDRFQAGLSPARLYPHQQDDQRAAEIAGNQAGVKVGEHIWGFLTGHRDPTNAEARSH